MMVKLSKITFVPPFQSVWTSIFHMLIILFIYLLLTRHVGNFKIMVGVDCRSLLLIKCSFILAEQNKT